MSTRKLYEFNIFFEWDEYHYYLEEKAISEETKKTLNFCYTFLGFSFVFRFDNDVTDVSSKKAKHYFCNLNREIVHPIGIEQNLKQINPIL